MEMDGIETKKQATMIVEAIFDAITNTLVKKGEFSYPGFGIFSVRHSKARAGVNPKTGAKIQIAASNKPKFKASKTLKDSIK